MTSQQLFDTAKTPTFMTELELTVYYKVFLIADFIHHR